MFFLKCSEVRSDPVHYENVFQKNNREGTSSLGLAIEKSMENKKDFYTAFFASLLYNVLNLFWSHKILVSILLFKIDKSKGGDMSLGGIFKNIFFSEQSGIREYLVVILIFSHYLLKPLEKFRKKKVQNFINNVKKDLKIGVLREIEKKSLDQNFRPAEDWTILMMTE